MGQPLDPAAAERALEINRRQRRRVVEAAREPWWVWLAALLLVFLVWAARDFGQEARPAILMLGVVLLVGWTYLPKLSPRVGSMIGGGVRAHRSLVPLRLRIALFGVGIVGAALAAYVGDLAAGYLDRMGAPASAVQHPHTVVGLPVALLLTGLARGMDRGVRAWLGRRSG